MTTVRDIVDLYWQVQEADLHYDESTEAKAKAVAIATRFGDLMKKLRDEPVEDRRMSEEDLHGIESLIKQRVHVTLSEEDWSRGMAKAIFDKVPLLVAAVREERGSMEHLIASMEMDILNLQMAAVHWAGFYKGLSATPQQCPSWAVAEHLKFVLERMKGKKD